MAPRKLVTPRPGSGRNAFSFDIGKLIIDSGAAVGGSMTDQGVPVSAPNGYEPLVAKLASKLKSLPAKKKAMLVAQLNKVLRELA